MPVGPGERISKNRVFPSCLDQYTPVAAIQSAHCSHCESAVCVWPFFLSGGFVLSRVDGIRLNGISKGSLRRCPRSRFACRSRRCNLRSPPNPKAHCPWHRPRPYRPMPFLSRHPARTGPGITPYFLNGFLGRIVEFPCAQAPGRVLATDLNSAFAMHPPVA